MPSGSGASWPNSCPPSPRCTAWSPSWRSRPPACGPVPARPVSRSCCWTRTVDAGTPAHPARPGCARPRRTTWWYVCKAWSVRRSGRHRRLPRGAPTPDDTDWTRIAALYATLAELTPSPVVELNRAVALAMAYGPGGWPRTRGSAGRRASAGRLPPAAQRARDLLAKLGRSDEARTEFERAAGMTSNERERTLLLDRARDAGGSATLSSRSNVEEDAPLVLFELLVADLARIPQRHELAQPLPRIQFITIGMIGR